MFVSFFSGVHHWFGAYSLIYKQLFFNLKQVQNRSRVGVCVYYGNECKNASKMSVQRKCKTGNV